MGLNANKLPSKQSTYVPVDPGAYPSRLVAVIDLGLQAQRAFQGEDKSPARELATTYELVDEFMKDEDGNPDPTKPRWITETLPFYPLTSTKAKATQRYKVFDPDEADEGDWVKQIGKPVLLTVVHNESKGRIYENVGGISAMRPKDAEKCEPLVNKPIVFDLDSPDKEVWDRLPKFIKDKIQGGLEYEGSALEKLVGKQSTPPKTAQKTEAKPAAKKAPAKKTEEDELPY